METACAFGTECTSRGDNVIVACSGGCGINYHGACIGLGRYSNRFTDGLLEHFELICPRCKGASLIDVLTKVNQLKLDFTLTTGKLMQKSQDAIDAENRLSDVLEDVLERVTGVERNQNDILTKFQEIRKSLDDHITAASITEDRLESRVNSVGASFDSLGKRMDETARRDELISQIEALQSDMPDIQLTIDVLRSNLERAISSCGTQLKDNLMSFISTEISELKAQSVSQSFVMDLSDQINTLNAKISCLESNEIDNGNRCAPNDMSLMHEIAQSTADGEGNSTVAAPGPREINGSEHVTTSRIIPSPVELQIVRNCTIDCERETFFRFPSIEDDVCAVNGLVEVDSRTRGAGGLKEQEADWTQKNDKQNALS